MHRIDGPGATLQNTFTEGDPQLAIPATTVTDDFLNAVQEEIVDVILTAGLALNKPDNTQLRQAVQALIAAAVPDTADFVAKTGAQTMAGPLTIQQQLLLQLAGGSTLAGDVKFDTIGQLLRIAENGGTGRGVSFDLSLAAAAAGSDGNFIVASGGSGINRWWKYSNGLIVQVFASAAFGGVGAVTPFTATLPTSFTTAVYGAAAVIEANGNSTNAFLSLARDSAATTLSTLGFFAVPITATSHSNWQIVGIAIGA